jgi:hypothetical protein
MKAQHTVTNAAVVRVYSHSGGAGGIRHVVVQNNGAVAARITLGGATGGVADAPTTTTGLRIAAGASLELEDGRYQMPLAIDAISEGADTTIDVVTD